MVKFLSVAAGAVIFMLYWFYTRYRARKKIRQKLAESWGDPKQREHNWTQIRYCHDLIKDPSAGIVIDDETWDDLNFDDLFGLIDRTESFIGQQVLFDLLRRPVQNVDILQKREQLMQLFKEQAELRIDVQMALRKLTGYRIWRLPTLIFDDLPVIPRWFYAFLLIPFLVVISVALGFMNPVFFFGLAGIPIVNIIIQYLVGGKVAGFTAAISALRPFLSTAEKICDIDDEYGNPLGYFGKKLREQSNQLKTLKKRVSNYLYEKNPDNIGTLLWDYLNLLLLLKINMFTFSVRAIRRNQKTLQDLHFKVGYLDALISTASYKSELEYCTPVFHSNGTLNYGNMYHPLLDDPVPNSIRLTQKGILVTGSNMAGKTTFLKTLGVNQILAQTLNFCCAERAEIPFCNVISSMRREDDLTKDKSFYLGEVERVKKLVDLASAQKRNNLFLLDEIFRGTNTIERISASATVLDWLNRPGNYVLASTHDLELVNLLDESYEFYQFSEKVGEQNLIFDYKIKPGYSSTKNAIQLLDIWKYPDEIVEGATEISQILERQGVINFNWDDGKD